MADGLTGLMGQMPRRFSVSLSRPLGWMARRLPGRRRTIAQRNTDMCFPGLTREEHGRVLADQSRYNALIEQHVRTCPEQYRWIHRRFRTRPEGEPPFYD